MFGRRVREARERLGLTQAQLADELRKRGQSLDPTMVAKVEAATRPTNVAEVSALAWALQLESVGRLFGEGDWSDDEFALMQLEWAYDRLRARQDEVQAQQEAIDREARILAQRSEELEKRGAYGGEQVD